LQDFLRSAWRRDGNSGELGWLTDWVWILEQRQERLGKPAAVNYADMQAWGNFKQELN